MAKLSADVTIVGAGLSGCLLAIYLQKLGHGVHLLEKRADMRKHLADVGRSINLAMSARGLHALKEVGLEKEILGISIPMYGRMVHLKDGAQQFQKYSIDENTCIYSVSRRELNCKLLDLAEASGAVSHFNTRISTTFSRPLNNELIFSDPTSENRVLSTNAVVGADGAYSLVRKGFLYRDRFEYSHSYIEHGYKELSIPPGPNGTWRLDKNSLHIWPRGSLMLIALPNLDGGFTCTLFFPFEGEPSFQSLDTVEKAREFFKNNFTDALELMVDFDRDWKSNPVSSLITVKCFPWSYDNTLLIGDAAHAIVPFFGQGMNASFEDCSVLNECLLNHKSTDKDFWKSAFKEFERKRKKNADSIAQLALENFVEMRDLVADPTYLFRKKVATQLGLTFPKFISRYELVSFSLVDYAKTIEIGEKNDEIISELTKGADIHADPQIDLKRAEELIDAAFSTKIQKYHV